MTVVDRERLRHIRSVVEPIYNLYSETRNLQLDYTIHSEGEEAASDVYVYAARILDFCRWLEEPHKKPRAFIKWYGEALTMEVLESKCIEYRPYFQKAGFNAHFYRFPPDIIKQIDSLSLSIAKDQEANGVYVEGSRDHRQRVIKQVLMTERCIGFGFKKINWVDIYAILHDSKRYNGDKYGELLYAFRQRLRVEIRRWVGETLRL